MFTSWPVVQALIETGHTLPMTANKYLLSCGLELIPLSLVRCLLQHGLCFSDGILQAVVCDGRIDILQLACARGHASQITSDMISKGAQNNRWQVVVWAARNNMPLDIKRLLEIIDKSQLVFKSQHAELRSYLTQLHKSQVADTKGQKRKR